jgi:heme exporter protein A
MVIAATHIPLGLEGVRALDMAHYSHEVV